MVDIAQLNKLRGIASSKAQIEPRKKQETPSSIDSQVHTSSPANINNLHPDFDPTLLIDENTKYDEWGMPIITYKEIKKGIERAKEIEENKSQPPQSLAEEASKSTAEIEKTDEFGIPIT